MEESLKQLGKQLFEHRQAKNLTIAQLANITKISPSYLEMMEQGRFDFLPDVYVRAFLRTVAKEIGLDPEVMTKQLEKSAVSETAQEITGLNKVTIPPAEDLQAETEIGLDVTKKKESANKNPYGLMSIYLLGGMAILLTLLLFLWPTEQKSIKENEIESGITIAKSEPMTFPDSRVFVPIDSSSLPDTLQVQPVTIHLHATETAWLRIVYNDSLEEEGLFSAGDARTFTGFGKIFLKIGNAGGIQMTLNGKELGVVGKKGSVVNLSIDAEGVKIISDAEFPKSKNSR